MTTTLLPEVTCPSCWHKFPPEDVLFVSRHPDWIGDPMHGPEAPLRFRPMIFSINGNAIDPGGVECRDIACPRCACIMPRAMLEIPSIFFSIVGAPSAGKSFFLASLTWSLRSRSLQHGLQFSDGEASMNAELHHYEERLFLNPDQQTLVTLDKTQEAGRQLYQSVLIDGRTQLLPRSFSFIISPSSENHDDVRVLLLYDNAGESFLTANERGADVTQHLSCSEALLVLFDPLLDVRFRQAMLQQGVGTADPALTKTRNIRQDTIINEMASRVRRFRGWPSAKRSEQPVIVILPKADTWSAIVGIDLDCEPIHDAAPATLDMASVERVSCEVRSLLLRVTPEIVNAVESFSSKAYYLPVSATGGSPVEFPGRPGVFGFRPADLKPKWVLVPLYLALAESAPHLVRKA